MKKSSGQASAKHCPTYYLSILQSTVHTCIYISMNALVGKWVGELKGGRRIFRRFHSSHSRHCRDLHIVKQRSIRLKLRPGFLLSESMSLLARWLCEISRVWINERQ